MPPKSLSIYRYGAVRGTNITIVQGLHQGIAFQCWLMKADRQSHANQTEGGVLLDDARRIEEETIKKFVAEIREYRVAERGTTVGER